MGTSLSPKHCKSLEPGQFAGVGPLRPTPGRPKACPPSGRSWASAAQNTGRRAQLSNRRPYHSSDAPFMLPAHTTTRSLPGKFLAWWPQHRALSWGPQPGGAPQTASFSSKLSDGPESHFKIGTGGKKGQVVFLPPDHLQPTSVTPPTPNLMRQGLPSSQCRAGNGTHREVKKLARGHTASKPQS